MIFDTLQRVIKEQTGVNKDSIDSTSTLKEMGIDDVWEIVCLTQAIEDEFMLPNISYDDTVNWNTLQDVEDYIKSKV